MPKTPSVTLKFASNNSFVVHNPVFVIHGTEGVVGFCLAIQPADEDVGTIGQNFMTGYRMVFDRENLKLGWSGSNCEYTCSGQYFNTALCRLCVILCTIPNGLVSFMSVGILIAGQDLGDGKRMPLTPPNGSSPLLLYRTVSYLSSWALALPKRVILYLWSYVPISP
ncbi:unnamed protein product [Ilex paraguariensis]|uniref:Peptidase A1 domain-containing protein n=1 Tax=Ilex paraguariensis TaxID=185542 RepID=A0ABC8TC05_9AQUA